MSKERELLERALRTIEPYASDYEAYELIDKIQELLAQPEQCDKKTYIGETQWMQVPEPLSDEEIKGATKNMSEFGADMVKAGVRSAEKAHGIGVGDE